LCARLWVSELLKNLFLYIKYLNAYKAAAPSADITGWNQDLYNGFLAAGLIWSLSWPPPAVNTRLAGFFLICVLVAGVFGALTIKPINRILPVAQALPALLALVALWLRA
jgi:putative membrane protein